ncbi:MAG: lipopolysaccharide biosynthesis protein [Bryobacteraceae bacterium]
MTESKAQSRTSRPWDGGMAMAAALLSGLPGPGVFRDFSWSMLSRAVTIASNMVFLAVTARLFGKEDVALLAVTAILTALMDAAKGLGLGTVLLKRLPKLDEAGESAGTEASELVCSYLFYSLLPPAGAALAVIAAAVPLSQYFFGHVGQATGLRLGAVLALLAVLTNTNQLVLQAAQRFGQLARSTILSGALQRLAPCLMAMVWPGRLEGFLEWSVVFSVVAFAQTLGPVVRMAARSRARILGPREFWGESGHFYFANLLRYGATQADQLFVAAAFEPATLAAYYMLRRLYSLAVVVIGAAIDTLTPGLSRQAASDPEGARNRLGQYLRVFLFGATVAAALFAGNGETIVPVLLGAGYGDDLWLILLFAVSGIVYFLFGFAQLDLVLFEHPKWSFRLGAMAAVGNAIASAGLALVLGARGLPLAMALGYLAGIELLRQRRLLAGWEPRELWIAVSVTALVALASHAAVETGANGWARALVVNALIAAFAWDHFRRWRIGPCIRAIL